jgi:hypothetical protein
MAVYKVIAADTKHFKSLLNDYKKDLALITYTGRNIIAELEDIKTGDIVALYNAELTPPAYLK